MDAKGTVIKRGWTIRLLIGAGCLATILLIAASVAFGSCPSTAGSNFAVLAGGASGTGANAFLYPVAYLGQDDQLGAALSSAGAATGPSLVSGARAAIFDGCPNQEVARRLLDQEVLVASVRCSAVDLLKALGGTEWAVNPFVPTLIAEGLIGQDQAAETHATLAAQTAAEAFRVAASKPGYGASIRRWTKVDPATGKVSHYLDIGPFGGSVGEMVMQVNLALED